MQDNPLEFSSSFLLPEEAADLLGIRHGTLKKYCLQDRDFLNQVRDMRGGLIAVDRELVEQEAAYRTENGGDWKSR